MKNDRRTGKYAPRHEDVLGECILNFGTRWRRVVSVMRRPLYSQGKNPGNH